MVDFLKMLNEYLWGTPLLCLLVGTHLFFTIRLKFIQKNTWKAIKLSLYSNNSDYNNIDYYNSNSNSNFNDNYNNEMRKKIKKKDGFSGFGALATTLAATLGTGNIVGVSTAVYFGGPGAIFWCWITGILGMATSYAECYLSVKYQQKDKEGHFYGGPMYVIRDGLHNKYLAGFYAFCVMLSSFGAGCATQANSLAQTASYLWYLPTWFIGIIASILVGSVLLTGFSAIETFCMKLVPIMGILYLSTCILILILNYEFLWDSLVLIVRSAFSNNAISGGLFGTGIGYSMKMAARYGIARGLFTNEAGLGTAGITAAGSIAKPEEQALISMTATFWDTVVCCAITGLVIVTNLLRFPQSVGIVLAGNLTNVAFEVIPYIGGSILGVCMVMFSLATLIGWSYMGQQAFSYLFSKKRVRFYQTIYLVMIFLGSIFSLELVWELTDIINFFIVIPNLIGLFLLYRY